ncbi:MAG TPA: hypothetical protein VM598_10090 [Bdellovibrionota bacterium]|nr:hypothetical protein [Bdellovibrionota bacterium]
MLCALGSGCASDPEAANYTYGGAGSNWQATLNGDGTFTITESDSGMTATGTYETLSTGFLRLTVSSASGTGAPSAGDQALALNVPGFVFLLKPLGDGSPIIPMVPIGTCPSANMTANWILTETNSDISLNTTEGFGTFTYTASTGAVALPTKYAIDNTSLGAGTIGTFTCSGGVGTLSGGEEMWFNPSGGAIVHGGSGDIILAMTQATVGSAAALNGNYSGLVFSNNGGGDDTFPVMGTLSGGTGTFTQVTNVATGTLGTESATLSFSAVDSPSAGFVDGNLAVTADATNPMQCMVTLNANGSGKNVIMCLGEEPGTAGGVNNVYTLLLVQR